MNLARSFKAGKNQQKSPRRVATPEIGAGFNPSLRDDNRDDLIPGVKTPG
jgi:hypothetical protein